jgi:hypothetical protein
MHCFDCFVAVTLAVYMQLLRNTFGHYDKDFETFKLRIIAVNYKEAMLSMQQMLSFF